MFEILRNMWRRKLRTALTIFGIAVGVFAFTVLGAMAEKMNALVEGGIKYLTGQIAVTPKTANIAGFLPQEKIDQLRKIEGVNHVQPEVTLTLDDMSMVQFGMPMMIIGPDLKVPFENVNYPKLDMETGEIIDEKDIGQVSLGIDVAAAKKAKVGGKIKIRGKWFKVKGIVAKTLTGPDKMVFMNLADAQNILISQDSFLKNLKKKDPKAKELTQLYTDANLSWKKGADPEKIAKLIEKNVSEVKATSPKKSKKEFEQFSVIFSLVTAGSALIALVVGGLSVINTMVMSVSERTREIGVKKAIGAKTRHVLGEYLIEAALIGLLGGAIGVGLGYLAVQAINGQASAGNQIFLLTGRLATSGLIFATVLGVGSGLWPAIHAARLNPVTALKAD